MGVKKAGIFVVSLFLMVFLLGIASAQDNCGVKLRTECLEANGDYIVFGLSGSTNAHGEVVQFNAQQKVKCLGTPTYCGVYGNQYDCYSQDGCYWVVAAGFCFNTVTACSSFDDNQVNCESQSGCSYGVNYDYVLCCDGQGLQPNECNIGPNKIIGLSSITNAHGEIPEGTSYTTEVCYGSLECESNETSPGVDYNAILSLSGDGTNAHIGNPGAYATKIWCNVEYTGTYCGDWIKQTPNDLDQFEECDDGNNIDNDTCSNNCELTGVILEPEAHWASSKTTDSYLWTEELYIGYTTIYLVLKYSGLPQGTVVSFEIFEADTFPNPDDDIRVVADARKGIVDSMERVVGNWTVSYTDWQNADDFLEGDEYEFYFKADDNTYKSNELKATVKEAPFCPTISLCLDYSASDSCGNDVCERAAFSVELNSDIKCDDEGITCECWWDTTTGKCNSRWGDGTGWCEYTETIQDECTEENLFLTYIITANWDNSGEELPPDCVGGSNAVPCPAQIQLPFINIYNLIAIIVVIVLIYFLLNLKKKKRKVSKKKK